MPLRLALLLPLALLSALPAVPLAADEVYRVVRPDGTVVYTDQAPDRRAKPLRFGPISGSTPGGGRKPPGFYSPEILRQAAKFVVRVESPTPGQVHRDGSVLVAAASVMPGLVKGYSLVYQVDGRALTEAPSESLSLPLPPLAAGRHELVVVLLDPRRQEVARSEPTPFDWQAPESANTARGAQK